MKCLMANEVSGVGLSANQIATGIVECAVALAVVVAKNSRITGALLPRAKKCGEWLVNAQ
jgi:hypothetical protein